MSTSPHTIPPSPLRYLGGKSTLAPWLLQLFPSHSIYVEPFCGSAAVLLSKSPAPVEIINDVSGDIVNFFRVLRHPRLAKKLADLCALTPFAEEEFAAACLPRTRHPLERARAFLFRTHANFHPDLSKQSFRISACTAHVYSAEWHNVPARLAPAAQRLKNCTISQRDFAELLPRYDKPGAFIYCDPPYLPETRSSSGKYANELTVDRHRELCNILASFKHASWAISGYQNPLYDELLPWRDKHTCAASTTFHSARTEVLWTSYKSNTLFKL